MMEPIHLLSPGPGLRLLNQGAQQIGFLSHSHILPDDESRIQLSKRNFIIQTTDKSHSYIKAEIRHHDCWVNVRVWGSMR
jgi:hypothetical protein